MGPSISESSGIPKGKNLSRACGSTASPAVHRAGIFSARRDCTGETRREATEREVWHARAPVVGRPRISGKVRADSIAFPIPLPGSMTESKPTAPARIAPAGLMFLAITSVGWGFNWPVTKYLLSELPPLTLARHHRRDRRGAAGGAGAGALAEPEGRAASVAAADAGGAAQRHRLDGADGAGAVVAAGERSGADRLHHAGLGLAAGLAGARRAADGAAHGRAGDGVCGPRRHHGRQRH